MRRFLPAFFHRKTRFDVRNASDLFFEGLIRSPLGALLGFSETVPHEQHSELPSPVEFS